MTKKTTELAVYKYQPLAVIGTKANLKAMGRLDPQTISALLPKDMSFEKLVALLALVANDNATIMQCTQESGMKAMAYAALTGLPFVGPMQQACIVPRRIKGTWTACFEPMYKGLVRLAHKSGQVSGIQTGAVFSNDKYHVSLTGDIDHDPLPAGDRGVIVGYYTIITMKHGAKQNTFLRADEVESIRVRSQADKRGFSAWKSDPIEMGKKSCLKNALKTCPASAEDMDLLCAIEADNESLAIEIDKPSKHASDIIDSEVVEPPATAEDGEQLPKEFT